MGFPFHPCPDDGDQVQVSFCPVPILEVQEDIFSFGVTEDKSSS